jgi:hypothetical protein
MGKKIWRMIKNGELSKERNEIFMVYLEVLIPMSAWTEGTINKSQNTESGFKPRTS